MTMSPTVVCNNVLQRAFKEKISVSPMKLQKMMYFISCEYAKISGKELFSESFEVWKYGPVLRTVYDEFKSYGSSPIRTYAKSADGRSCAIDENTAPNLQWSLNSIWETYKNYTGIELSKITHKDGSGWSKAYETNQDKISLEDMKGDRTYVSQCRS